MSSLFISSLSLIIVNLIPLYGVIFWDWQLFPIILLYWLENVIMGLLNVLKMSKITQYTLSQDTIPNKPFMAAKGMFQIPFFLVHYGIFTLVHGTFVFTFFGNPNVNIGEIFLGFLSLLLSHGLSFLINFIGKEEYKKLSIDQQMMKPYGRIIVLHMTIIFGGALVQSLGSPPAALAVMVFMKIAIDLTAHLKEHITKIQG